MSTWWWIFWHGPAVGVAILASVGIVAIIASWLVDDRPLRFGLRRIGIWLVAFGLIFLAAVAVLIILPGPLDKPENGISLDICIILAIATASGLLEKVFPGFHGNDQYST